MLSQAMPLREIYQVDAFTDRPFSGNPAAVCPLPEALDWPDSGFLQALAQENNLSETAYFKPSSISGVDFDLRWFTPSSEVQLCGHATLASAFVLFHYLDFEKPTVRFSTLSGVLGVTRTPHTRRLTLDLPIQPIWLCASHPLGIEEALGARPTETYF
jgi:PhzF family phenazine biosynthesis protein